MSVAHELGLPAIDLRSVARRVNTTATGLRRHIGTTELMDAVVSQIVASMPPVPARGDRLRRLRSWAEQTRAWLTDYPGLASHLLANRWDVPEALDRVEDVARVLGDAGLAPSQAASAAVTLYWFFLGSADLDMSPRVIGGDPAAPAAPGGGGSDSPAAERWPLLGD
ncbi:MAG: TetR/AcrR family transcriptional regulator C-terminal domain-containing protein, partial [Acidimicrobiales bacterium]